MMSLYKSKNVGKDYVEVEGLLVVGFLAIHIPYLQERVEELFDLSDQQRGPGVLVEAARG